MPLGFLAGLLTLALVFLVLGLVYQRRDAPLRRPDLPMVHGTVLDRPGQAHDCDGSHAAEGRELTVVFRWSGRPPALETLTPIRFVSGDSGRARPAAGAWDPRYQYLFAFAGCFAAMVPVAYLSGVLGARRRLRKRAQAEVRDDQYRRESVHAA